MRSKGVTLSTCPVVHSPGTTSTGPGEVTTSPPAASISASPSPSGGPPGLLFPSLSS